MASMYLLTVKTEVEMGKNNFSAVAFWIKLVVIYVFCKDSFLELYDKNKCKVFSADKSQWDKKRPSVT